MRIHAIVCTYLGDGELDIGKTGRWVQWFVDSVYFYDASGSLARKYVIDYGRSFPDAQFGYHPASAGAYQTDPSNMRQMAFEAASKAWRYEPDDWVVFIDGTEGLTFDIPRDSLELLTPTSIRFRYLYDEAEAADIRGYAELPTRIFLSQGEVVEHDYIIKPDFDNENPANHAVWWSCSPHFLGTMDVQWKQMRRFFKVSYLLDDPDWSLLDVYRTIDQSVQTEHAAMVSYSYARFSEVNYHDSSLWAEADDQGFQSRLFMQQVPGRYVAELPIDYDTPDPVGAMTPIPPGPARIITRDPPPDPNFFVFEGHVTWESGNEVYAWNFGDGDSATGQFVDHTFPGGPGPFTVVLTVSDPDVGSDRTASVVIQPGTFDAITEQEPTPPAGPAPVRQLCPPYCYYVNRIPTRDEYVMAFTALWRLNPRDGVWWQELVVGPPPLSPIDGTPAVDPAAWAIQQPHASPQPPVAVNEPGPGV